MAEEPNYKKEERGRAKEKARAQAVASKLKGALKSEMNPKKEKHPLYK